VLIGPSGSGKTAWAADRYLPREIVSADQLRAVAGSGEHDLDASADAFSLLDQIVAARTGRGLTAVVDTLGLDAGRRLGYLEAARRAGLPAVAVIFQTPVRTCRERNRGRERPVPAAVLDAQLRRMPEVSSQVGAEGWDVVVRPGQDQPDLAQQQASARHQRTAAEQQGSAAEQQGSAASQPARTPGGGVAASHPGRPAGMDLILQVSRFPWGDDPAGWLRSVALAADQAGLAGLALMDHLIQIPQVGRAWEPIPEPWVTLGMLAGLDTGLRLGTLVTPATFLPGGVLAKAAATLDAISGGRAFCGIGAGWWEREHAGFGLPFPPPGARLDAVEKAIETMRALWQPGTRPHDGERVSLPETTCYPRPEHPIPVIVGGSGERSLRIAARLGDGCNVPSDLAALDRSLETLRRHCREAGREPGEVQVTVLDIPVIGRDRGHVADLVERLRGRTGAAAFARRHNAGTAADHLSRYQLLAARGVSSVFVSLPDLAGPGDVLRLEPLAAAFAA
jgi:alkanesulfonate monooxygenase SsuD/methylene tetrahydromethanopterin reductase-like flavin-dependent oxidoreductase (luciferase family)/predicted kinase